jgi:hypothetical protein
MSRVDQKAQCDQKVRRAELRFLKLLNSSGSTGLPVHVQGEQVLLSSAGRRHAFPASLAEGLERRQLVERNGGRISLREEGRARLMRLLHPGEAHLAQNSDLRETSISAPEGSRTVRVNDSESPLARLYSRKDKNGKAWIDEAQYQAGERLRSDFEKACLQPRISANWEAAVAGRSRSAAQAGDISDFALDARNRFNRALAAVGPELAGVAVDICCFLHGLEQVERARGWPPRSAKLMLRTALDMLVRHYGLKTGTGARSVRQWGTQDYRPEITE